jgi:ribosomal protein S18 acetylase RimI-like enzyme
MTLAVSKRAVAVKRLDWDTGFFGVLMGTIALADDASPRAPEQRADALHADLRELLTSARVDGYRHLIFRVPCSDLSAVWAAERAGFRLVDIGIDSSILLGPNRPARPTGRLDIRPLRTNEVSILCQLGAEFTLSRFSADPFFSAEQVDAFYRQWISNLCSGLEAQILVCDVDGAVAGFVSCALDGGEGRIPLIASSASFRRRGVGRDLVNAALVWFAAAGARVVHVKTQAQNCAALALYHGAGFTVSKTDLTFSIVPDRAA